MSVLIQKCLAIAASLCVNGPASIEVERGAAWTGARIRIGNVLVVSTTYTDNLAYPDRRRMNKHCVRARSCIFYYKHCLTSAGRADCVIYYNELNDDYNRSIQLSASDMSLVVASFSNLAIVVSTKNDFVPLSDLSKEGASAAPPYCRPKLDSGCRHNS